MMERLELAYRDALAAYKARGGDPSAVAAFARRLGMGKAELLADAGKCDGLLATAFDACAARPLLGDPNARWTRTRAINVDEDEDADA